MQLNTLKAVVMALLIIIREIETKLNETPALISQNEHH